MKLRHLILPSLLATAFVVSAQSRYDDDIYYNASKDTKTKQENAAYKKAVAQRKAQEAEEQRKAEQEAFNRLYQQYYGDYDPERGGEDYEAAGNQTVVASSSDRDVDEYNRRGAYSRNISATDSAAQTQEDFTYTRNIERFYDSDIIAKSNDKDLVEYYYSSQQQPEINIYYVNDTPYSWLDWGWDGWSWGPYYSYYSPYWRWNTYWSWGYPGWGLSWSLSWGYPGWGWGYPLWGWDYPGWGWGAPHHHGWGWVGGHGLAGGRHDGHMASRYTTNGRRPSGIRNGYTGLGGSRGQLSGTTRNRYNFTTGQAGNYRPGRSTGIEGGRSTTNNDRSTLRSTSGNRNNRSNYNSNNSRSNSTNNSGSYNSGSSSRGGWGGGNSGGGSTGGGGGHRGGRR